MNKPFTPPETVPARRDWHADAWDRPVRGSFLVELDDGRTGMVVGDDVRRFFRGLFWGLTLTGLGLLAIAGAVALWRLS